MAKTAKLTGKMLHEAYSQADDEIIRKQFPTIGATRRDAPKPWEEISATSQRAYNRMAALLNERLQKEEHQ